MRPMRGAYGEDRPVVADARVVSLGIRGGDVSDRRAQTWDVLGEVVDAVTYVDRSRFALERDDDANYALLYIFITAPNSYRDDRADRHTRHEFVVPVATYDRENWIRWLFEQLKSIEIHEVCEWFKVDGQRVYPPHHGNGEIPYVEWHLSTAERAALAPGESRPESGR